MSLRCRCDRCGELVETWIGMVCVPCHDRFVFKAGYASAVEDVDSDLDVNYYESRESRADSAFEVFSRARALSSGRPDSVC